MVTSRAGAVACLFWERGPEGTSQLFVVWCGGTYSGLGSAATFTIDPDVLGHDLSLLVEGHEGRQLSITRVGLAEGPVGAPQRDTVCASLATPHFAEDCWVVLEDSRCQRHWFRRHRCAPAARFSVSIGDSCLATAWKAALQRDSSSHVHGVVAGDREGGVATGTYHLELCGCERSDGYHCRR